MPGPAEGVPPPGALLIIRAGQSSWAIPSSAVFNVERPGSGSGSAALDVLALLGRSSGDGDLSERIVVLQVGAEHVRLLVRGELRLAESRPTDLLALPPALRRASPLISHVAVVDGKPAVFVLSPERLLHASRSQSALSITDDSARGSSC